MKNVYFPVRRKIIHRLSKARVAEIIREGKSGWYCDGGGLYIQIPVGTFRSYWFFKYWKGSARRNTKRGKLMSLGPTRLVTLAEARKIAEQCREYRRAGLDPKAEREKARKRNARAAAAAVDNKPEWDSYLQFRHATERLRADFEGRRG